MEFNLAIGGRKNTGKFQGVVKVLMEFHGKKGKKQWKIPGGIESKVLMEFQGRRVLKMVILNRGVWTGISGRAQFMGIIIKFN